MPCCFMPPSLCRCKSLCLEFAPSTISLHTANIYSSFKAKNMHASLPLWSLYYLPSMESWQTASCAPLLTLHPAIIILPVTHILYLFLYISMRSSKSDNCSYTLIDSIEHRAWPRVKCSANVCGWTELGIISLLDLGTGCWDTVLPKQTC